MDQMNNQSSSNDCQIAFDVVTNPFAQFARAIIILFNFATLFCLIFLILEYKRTKLALHGNLKLLYLNILIFYAIGIIGYFIAEFRNIIISISSSNDPCGMLTPAWFAFLSRMLQFFQSIGITFSHLAVMIERIRATLLAHNYEWEGIKFAIISIIFVYAINFLLLFLIGNTVLIDWEWNIQKMLAMNTMVTKNSNQLVIFIHFLMLFFIALTAFGDYILFKKNKQRRINNTTSAGDGRRVVEYNLSENYQLNENINAIRLILPLDIAYLLFMSMYLAMVIVLRMFQVIIPQSTFLACYNLITLSLLSYAIISLLFYRKFLRMNKSRLATNIVMAQMDMGNAYFQQFQTQWR